MHDLQCLTLYIRIHHELKIATTTLRKCIGTICITPPNPPQKKTPKKPPTKKQPNKKNHTKG